MLNIEKLLSVGVQYMPTCWYTILVDFVPEPKRERKEKEKKIREALRERHMTKSCKGLCVWKYAQGRMRLIYTDSRTPQIFGDVVEWENWIKWSGRDVFATDNYSSSKTTAPHVPINKLSLNIEKWNITTFIIFELIY